MFWSRLAAASGLAALGLSSLPVAGTSAEPGAADPRADRSAAADAVPRDDGRRTTVTLVTGDVVTVTEGAEPGGAPVVGIERAPGSTGGVQTYTVDGDLHVVPDAALPYLAQQRLDADLFDVTGLIEQGYDDASVDAVPLIARYAPGVRAARAPAPEHARRGAVLTSIRGAALRAPKAQTADFWADLTAGAGDRFTGRIARLDLDEKVEASLADSVAQVGAPEAWAAGLDGTGVTVAVLDTGADTSHPDLAGQVEVTRSFIPGEDATYDVDGHGTHVASTVAGSGAASDGLERGVAPGARLAIGKVLDNSGSGTASQIIEGMEWGAEVAPVVSMSLGTVEPSDGTDPMSQALDALSRSTGALFVVAAGNYGRTSGIGAPGAAETALTVGAVDGDDVRADFQDMGPRLGDAVVKPEIVAPGVDVLAARSSASFGEGRYVSLSGTSMATPHVAGAAAVLAQEHPEWDGAQLRDALVSTSLPLPGQIAYQVGAGRLDVPAAAFGDVVATASAELGYHAWPADDDQPVDRTVTYTNLGDADVVLQLDAEVTDAALEPAPEGLVTLSDDEVTVPAGGTATVTVTGDPTAGLPGRDYSGAVVASLDGEPVARTAVGLVKERERYDLDVRAVGRDGEPTGGYVSLYRFGDFSVSTLELDPETGTLPTQRLEPGVYNVTSWLPVDENDSGVALVGDPHLVIDDASRTLVLDARKARPVELRTARPSVDGVRRPSYFHEAGVSSDADTFSNAYDVPPSVERLYAQPTGPVPGPRYEFAMRWRRTAPLLTVRTGGRALPVLAMPSARRWDGTATLDAAALGDGEPADYTGRDVRGRAVLVQRNDRVSPDQQVETAARAGARLVVVVNDRPGRYLAWTGDTELPVLSVERRHGRPLVERLGRGDAVRLTLTGTEQPPYLYDLARAWPGRVPVDLAWAPRQGALATVTNRFVGTAGRLAIESRADCRDWHWPPCLQEFEPVHLGAKRVDYVSTQAGMRWYEDVVDPRGWEQRGAERTYRPGQQRTQSWFDPVVRPRTGAGFWGPHRSGRFFAVNVPFASAGTTGVTGAMTDASTVETRLYADGELVDVSPFQAVQTDVPPATGWQRYRFEMDARRPASWVTSPRSSTSWEFRAQTTPVDADLPLLQLDYGFTTDLAGALAGGRSQPVTLRAAHTAGVTGAGRVDRASLRVSFDDGTTWRRVALKQPGGGAGATAMSRSWTGAVRVPAGARFVTVRATAGDDAGNRVVQEVRRAVRVR
ncbi:S8 family serine peptidase [Nocardioides marinquilinus]|uniref:S8 family serine peptidase n=1 Tax=Nocardioides marinquilinus TaxID=1210400 RepID=A0ABP9PAV7_9ACTN